MLSLAAACLAPLCTMSQKVSPAPEWVTIAKVQRGVFTAEPSAASWFARSSARLPPVALHPARAVAPRTAANTTPITRLGAVAPGLPDLLFATGPCLSVLFLVQPGWE